MKESSSRLFDAAAYIINNAIFWRKGLRFFDSNNHHTTLEDRIAIMLSTSFLFIVCIWLICHQVLPVLGGLFSWTSTKSSSTIGGHHEERRTRKSLWSKVLRRTSKTTNKSSTNDQSSNPSKNRLFTRDQPRHSSSSSTSLSDEASNADDPNNNESASSLSVRLWEQWAPEFIKKPPIIIPSPFRILLPEEEEDLFFANTDNAFIGTMDNEVETVDGNSSCAGGCATSERGITMEDTAISHSTTTTATSFPETGISHFCFLVHGHRGHSRDLSYVQAVMRRFQKQLRLAAAQSPQPSQPPPTASTATKTATTTTTDGTSPPSPTTTTAQRLIVHSCTCNEKKTDDGVMAGGERLVDEMLQVIRTTMSSSSSSTRERKGVDGDEDDDDSTSTATDDTTPRPLRHVTVSLWGNSLGGLYSRYALSLLQQRCKESCRQRQYHNNNKIVLDDAYVIHYNIFCTTATPHLGISGHTFVALPRRAEIGVAHAMGETGKDLFRLNALLYEMATHAAYLQPLSLFNKRICYANAYGTDFPVPALTAAFLSPSSTYPHVFSKPTTTRTEVADSTETDSTPVTSSSTASSSQCNDSQSTLTPSSLVVATLHTPTAPEYRRTNGRGSHTTAHELPEMKASPLKDIDNCNDDDDDNVGETAGDDEAPDDELAQMSMALDALGWKKVFVDMRREVPRISIPKSLLPRSLASSSSMSVASFTSNGNNSNKDSSGDASDTASNSSEEDGSEEEMTLSDRLDNNMSEPASSERGVQPPPTAGQSMERLIQKGSVVSSRDVAAAVVMTPAMSEDELFALHWPIGHNMIVAFSRSRWSTYMNKAGRPIVDGLAKELVQDIFAYAVARDMHDMESTTPSNHQL